VRDTRTGTTTRVRAANGGAQGNPGGLSLPPGLSVATPQDALDALAVLESYFQEVATVRAAVGSALSGFEAPAPVPQGSPANSQAAETWIRDVALAEEAAGLAEAEHPSGPRRGGAGAGHVPPAVVLHILS
jgi:hypothetical protein